MTRAFGSLKSFQENESVIKPHELLENIQQFVDNVPSYCRPLINMSQILEMDIKQHCFTVTVAALIVVWSAAVRDLNYRMWAVMFCILLNCLKL